MTVTDPTLIGDLALVGAFRTLAGVIDWYRDQCELPDVVTADLLLAWETVKDASRDLAYTLLFTPEAEPDTDEWHQLGATLIAQVHAPWERT